MLVAHDDDVGAPRDVHAIVATRRTHAPRPILHKDHLAHPPGTNPTREATERAHTPTRRGLQRMLVA